MTLNRYGTSCLATISLLRDKSHSTIEAPHNLLSAFGLAGRGSVRAAARGSVWPQESCW
jgi:hypothetical protein